MLKAPCGTGRGPSMLQTTSFPSFSVSKVTRTPDQNGDNLLIDFEYDLADDKDGTEPKRRKRALAAKVEAKSTRRSKWKGWIEVSPNDGWAVRAYGAGEGAGRATSIHQEIVYGERRDGQPLPRRITRFEPVRATTLWLDIESIEFGRRPENEYTLSFYGIPRAQCLASGSAGQPCRRRVIPFGYRRPFRRARTEILREAFKKGMTMPARSTLRGGVQH